MAESLLVRGFDTSDLTTCDQEPIRIPGFIQPYGALFVINPTDNTVVQAAIGDADIAAMVGDPLGRKLADCLGFDGGRMLAGLKARLPEQGTLHAGLLKIGPALHHLIAHRSDGAIIVELERTVGDEPGSFDEVYPHVRDFLDLMQTTRAVEELAALAAREVRRITGLDRVLVYRFDSDWNGTVVAEDGNGVLPSYMDLRFPASDIPAQARELYRLNRLRVIADASYQPCPITPTLHPGTGKPTDLSYAVLRSVSPVHLEYMRNMGTAASMSISLLREGNLWGLISCHNKKAVRVPYHIRTACDFIGQMLSMQIAAKETTRLAEDRHGLRTVQTRLLAYMAASDYFVDGLLSHPDDLMALTGASSAAVVAEGRCMLVGDAPSEGEVHRIVDWLAEARQDLFATDSLSAVMPGASAMKDRASGLLAVSISQLHDSYLLWFRPEVIRTVTWSGDPHKPTGAEAGSGINARLHPRNSFEAWQETVRLKSAPWHQAEVDSASELRAAVVDIVLRLAEEKAVLSERLTAINRELEAFSYSVSHDLRAPFRHIVGYAQLLKKYDGDRLTDRGNRFIDTIVESAVSAGTLVDDLLSFSHMGRATLTPVRIDMSALFQDVRRSLTVDGDARQIEWRMGAMPTSRGDPVMLRLAIQNLVENALKFTRDRDPAVIEIGHQPGEAEEVFFVRDNGTGFDMAYVGKLFGVFQRLHRVEDFEGTGIGLANVKRIIERHGGRVWAEGVVDEGATFFFALPNGSEASSAQTPGAKT